jgi:triosephosphate isomerase (TIM)
MARRKMLMGNWKMHKTVAEARAFAEALGRRSNVLVPASDYAICAPFTAVHVLRVMLPASVKIGAQNVHFAEQGAFTGEISASMLKEFGVTYVIVGHSERRHIFGEPDEWIRDKTRRVIDAGMVPVLCVGENSEERAGNHTFTIVDRQVQSGLSNLKAAEVAQSIIAYEPVWAIGSGKTATVEDAEQVIAHIREVVTEQFGEAAGAGIRILYGGSVKAGNIATFMQQKNIDGALVGGASLEAESFAAMAENMGGKEE